MTLCGMHAIWCQYESVGICDCGFTDPFHEHCQPTTNMSKISFYRPPSIDRLEQVTLKECPCCGSSDLHFADMILACEFVVCNQCGMDGPSGKKSDCSAAVKWNSIPRRAEVRELLNDINLVAEAFEMTDWGGQNFITCLQKKANKLRKEWNL